MVVQRNRHPGIIQELERLMAEGRLNGPDGPPYLVCLNRADDGPGQLVMEAASTRADALRRLTGCQGEVIWACVNHLGSTIAWVTNGKIEVRDGQS